MRIQPKPFLIQKGIRLSRMLQKIVTSTVEKAWILATNFWNDEGVWKDDDTWND